MGTHFASAKRSPFFNLISTFVIASNLLFTWANVLFSLTRITRVFFKGVILPLFVFSFYISDMPHPDWLTLFKYADHILLGCVSSSCSDADFQHGLDRINVWTTKRASWINTSKILDACFLLSPLDKYLVLTSPLFNFSGNGTLIPQAQKLM